MTISTTTLITFSPTNTSLKVGQHIQKGFGATTQNVINVSLTPTPPTEITGNSLAIFSVPVYGGLVAPLALKRLETIKGNNTPAVIVVVYGNRDYEKALTQLETFVNERGFRVIAAATFIGEHSYSTDATPIATGRPNLADLEEATTLGKAIRLKTDAYRSSSEIPTVQASKISRPKQPLIPLLRFIYSVIRLRRSKVAMPAAPTVDAAKCKQCGLCAKHCPNGAIPQSEASTTIAEKCIKCCACVKICPHKARSLKTPFADLLAKHFAQPKTNHTLL